MPDIIALLESHNITVVQVPANCNDKLQPLDVSLNKPNEGKDEKEISGLACRRSPDTASG